MKIGKRGTFLFIIVYLILGFSGCASSSKIAFLAQSAEENNAQLIIERLDNVSGVIDVYLNGVYIGGMRSSGKYFFIVNRTGHFNLVLSFNPSNFRVYSEEISFRIDSGSERYSFSTRIVDDIKKDYIIPLEATGETRKKISSPGETDIERAIQRASIDLINELPANSIIAVINIASDDETTSVFVADELEFQLVESKIFRIVDRNRLNTIRMEQQFQMSGEVSDSSAVSIGQMSGASIVITGSITEIGTTQRLTLRALDVRTTEIVTMVRESF